MRRDYWVNLQVCDAGDGKFIPVKEARRRKKTAIVQKIKMANVEKRNGLRKNDAKLWHLLKTK